MRRDWRLRSISKHSFIHPSVHSSSYPSIHSSIHPFIDSFIHLLIYSFIYPSLPPSLAASLSLHPHYLSTPPLSLSFPPPISPPQAPGVRGSELGSRLQQQPPGSRGRCGACTDCRSSCRTLLLRWRTPPAQPGRPISSQLSRRPQVRPISSTNGVAPTLPLPVCSANQAQQKLGEAERRAERLMEQIKPLSMLGKTLVRNLSDIRELIEQTRRQAASVHTHIHTQTYIRTQTYSETDKHINIHTQTSHTSIQIYSYTHTNICTHTDKYTHTNMYTHTHAHRHTHSLSHRHTLCLSV